MAGQRGDGGGRAERERARRNFLESAPSGWAPRPGRCKARPSGARGPGARGGGPGGQLPATAGRAGRTHLLPNFPGIYLGNFRSEAEAVFPPSRRGGGGEGEGQTPRRGGRWGRKRISEVGGFGMGEKNRVTSFCNGGTTRTRRPPGPAASRRRPQPRFLPLKQHLPSPGNRLRTPPARGAFPTSESEELF